MCFTQVVPELVAAPNSHSFILGGPLDWQSDSVLCQTKVRLDCDGDILDREEATPPISWNSLGSERLLMSPAACSDHHFCLALCPSAVPFHPAHLPGGVPQASAQLARPCRYCLPLPRLHILPANEWQPCVCSEFGLYKRINGLVSIFNISLEQFY